MGNKTDWNQTKPNQNKLNDKTHCKIIMYEINEEKSRARLNHYRMLSEAYSSRSSQQAHEICNSTERPNG